MARLFKNPSTSVNHRRMNLTSCSAILLMTSSLVRQVVTVLLLGIIPPSKTSIGTAASIAVQASVCSGPHLRHVVAPQCRHCISKRRRGDDRAQSPQRRKVPDLQRNDQVIAFLAYRDEAQSVGGRRGAYTQAGRRPPLGHRPRHPEMGRLLLLVAGDVLRRHPRALERDIQPHAGPGTGLAVDEGHPGPRQVGYDGESLGIPRGHDETLDAMRQTEQHDPSVRQHPLHERHIVRTCDLIPQVRSGDVGLAAGHGDEPSQAAYEIRRQFHRGLLFAERTAQELDGQVMAPGEPHPGRPARFLSGGACG